MYTMQGDREKLHGHKVTPGFDRAARILKSLRYSSFKYQFPDFPEFAGCIG
jgi:hypothetical protein